MSDPQNGDPLAASIASDNPDYPFGFAGPSFAELQDASLRVRLQPMRDEIDAMRRSLPWCGRVLWDAIVAATRLRDRIGRKVVR